MVRLIMAKKRIRIKAGDIFEVIRCDGNKQYLQFLVVDRSMLDGDVIRVFKKHYAPEAVPSPEDIISDKVLFYAQTSVRRGVREEWWTKYGHSDDLGELKRIIFSSEGAFWYLWRVNKRPWIFPWLPKNIFNPGSIFPPFFIVTRINENLIYESDIERHQKRNREMIAKQMK